LWSFNSVVLSGRTFEMKKLALIAIAVLMISAFASAESIVPSLKSITPDGPGMYTWTYEVVLTTNDILKASNPGADALQYFTIYDFSGYVAGSASFTSAGSTSAADWSFVSLGTGLTTDGDGGIASNLIPGTPDAAGIPNLSWSYVGAGIAGTAGPNYDAFGNTILGFFSADSIYNGTTRGNYTGATFEFDSFSNSYIFSDNTGSVLVPLPEPSSILLLGSGLAGLAGLIRKRLA